MGVTKIWVHHIIQGSHRLSIMYNLKSIQSVALGEFSHFPIEKN